MGWRNVTADANATSDQPQSPTPFLVGEIGTATTKLTLIDLVDGAYRLIARAEAPSTLDQPTGDALHALWTLIPALEDITGRSLRSDDGAPPDPTRYRLVITTSAAGIAPVAIMALADASAHEATNAVRGIYARVVQDFSLDDSGRSEAGWISEQLARLASAKPEAIVLTGGLERGARAPVERLARLTRLLARSMRPMPWLLYAGNTSATAQVRAILGDVTVAANLRPTATTNRLEPARAALRSFYATQHLPALSGADTLQAHAITPSTVADNQGTMVRFLAARYARRTVFLDTGALHATGHAQADGHYSQVVLAGHGIGAGAPTLLQAVGTPTVARWLPFALPDGDVANRAYNRTVWGSGPPADVADLLLDHALLRESLHATLVALRAARPALDHDLVVAAGAIARSPSPGLAALTLIDALALEDMSGALAVDLYLDSLGLFAASGALAHIHADAAACVLEQDALNSGPLATLLVPQGAVVDGEAALDIELTSILPDGSTEVQSATVRGGQIVRFPLARNARGTLRIQPVRGVRIGANAAGVEVTTDDEAIIGSALGVIIDARPRPLQLPTDDTTRIARLRAWLAALDALPPTLLDEPTFEDVAVAASTATVAVDDDEVDVIEQTQLLDDGTPPELSEDVAAVELSDASFTIDENEPSEPSRVVIADEPLDASFTIDESEPPEHLDEPIEGEASVAAEPSESVIVVPVVEHVVYGEVDAPADEPASADIDAATSVAEPVQPDAAATSPITQRRRIARVYGVLEPAASSAGTVPDRDEQPQPITSSRGAVFKDDAPEPEPPRKKRRFLWW